MQPHRWLWVAFALVAPVFADTTQHKDPKGLVSIPLPSTWVVEPASSQFDSAILALDVLLPGKVREMPLTVHHLIGGQLSGLAQAHVDAAGLKDSFGGALPEVLLEPQPHCLVRFVEDGAEKFHLLAYRITKRNTLSISIEGPIESLQTVRPHLFAAATGLVSELPSWPSYPPNYRRSLEDGLEFVIHEGFPKKELERLKRRLRSLRKSYEKRVGKVPVRPEYPVQIVFHSNRAQARAIHEPASKRDYVSDLAAARVFVVPVYGDNTQAAADLAHAFVVTLHTQRFGTKQTGALVYGGEAHIAWSEALTGKSLPTIAQGLYERIAWPPMPLIEVPKTDVKQLDPYAALYQAFFHCGPSRYRKAFRAYLSQIDAHGDWNRAWRETILPLAGERFDKDIERFYRRKIRPARAE